MKGQLHTFLIPMSPVPARNSDVFAIDTAARLDHLRNIPRVATRPLRHRAVWVKGQSLLLNPRVRWNHA